MTTGLSQGWHTAAAQLLLRAGTYPKTSHLAALDSRRESSCRVRRCSTPMLILRCWELPAWQSNMQVCSSCITGDCSSRCMRLLGPLLRCVRDLTGIGDAPPGHVQACMLLSSREAFRPACTSLAPVASTMFEGAEAFVVEPLPPCAAERCRSLAVVCPCFEGGVAVHQLSPGRQASLRSAPGVSTSPAVSLVELAAI